MGLGLLAIILIIVIPIGIYKWKKHHDSDTSSAESNNIPGKQNYVFTAPLENEFTIEGDDLASVKESSLTDEELTSMRSSVIRPGEASLVRFKTTKRYTLDIPRGVFTRLIFKNMKRLNLTALNTISDLFDEHSQTIFTVRLNDNEGDVKGSLDVNEINYKTLLDEPLVYKQFYIEWTFENGIELVYGPDNQRIVVVPADVSRNLKVFAISFVTNAKTILKIEK